MLIIDYLNKYLFIFKNAAVLSLLIKANSILKEYLVVR